MDGDGPLWTDVEEAVVSRGLEVVSGGAEEWLGVYDAECGNGAGTGRPDENGVEETE